jgi:PAS domain S-box-containing protein
LRTSKVPLRDAEDNVMAVLGMYENITESKQMEEALTESESKFRSLYERSPDAIQVLDGEKFIDCNPATVKTLRADSKEAALNVHPSVLSPERQPDGRLSSEKADEMIRSALEQGSWRFEWIHRRMDGEDFPVEVTLTTALLSGRQILFSEWRDISERKQAEAELQAYREELEERVEARTIELESRVRELNQLQRLMMREGWQEFQTTRKQSASGYLFDQASVRPVERDELDIAANGQTRAEAATDKPTGHKAVTKPLAVSGESIGTLGIYEDDPDNPLSPEDQAFLDEVAAQVAEALERARLFEQSRSSLAETEALLTGSERVMQATTMKDILEAVVTSTALQKLDRAQLLFFDHPWDDEPPEFMTLTSFWRRRDEPSEFPEGTQFSLADFSTAKYFNRDEPSIFADLSTDPRVDEKTRAFLVGQIGMQGLIDFPLVGGGQWLGILHGDVDTPLVLSEEEIRLISSLIDLAASVIQNQRLFEESQQALAEVEATQRRYTVQAWEEYRARRRAMSYEEDREGVPPLGEQLPPEVSRAVAEKKPVAISAPPALPATGDDEPPADETKSSLVVPLTVRDEVIGVLGLQNTAEARNWTPEEITLVEAITEQVAQAAEQIRLFDETQQRAAREHRIGEIGDKIRAAQSLEEALQVAIKEVGLSLKAPQTTVKLEVE